MTSCSCSTPATTRPRRPADAEHLWQETVAAWEAATPTFNAGARRT